MTVEEFKKESGIEAYEPAISLVEIGRSITGMPLVWAVKKIFVLHGGPAWLVSTDRSGYSYMFKDTGLFGTTSNPLGRFENSFSTWQEANEHFRKFYQ